MTNFANITIADIALAMGDSTAKLAHRRLCMAAGITKPAYQIDTPPEVWSATSLANRHAQLMEWIDAELRSGDHDD